MAVCQISAAYIQEIPYGAFLKHQHAVDDRRLQVVRFAPGPGGRPSINMPAPAPSATRSPSMVLPEAISDRNPPAVVRASRATKIRL